MRWLCIFNQCRWLWHFNCDEGDGTWGIYQCSRCKTISVGGPRDRATGDFMK